MVDASAAARLSMQPFYNARLRTTCVATRVDAGHANNALPQTARAVVNCRILPGEATAPVEATLRRLAGEKVRVTVLYPPIASPPSPLPAPFLATLERLAAAQWPGVPLAPVMEAGATDGMYTRLAGIPTYARFRPSRRSRRRARARQGRARRRREFYEATEFWYRTIRAFGEER